MRIELNSVNSQELLLRLLTALRPADTQRILQQAEREPAWDNTRREYLFLCLSFAQTKREHPEYCGTLDGICRSIIARQTSADREKVRKKEYREGFGWTNNVQLGRIERGEAEMPAERIQRLCSAFPCESDRIFWENQLYAFFPDTCYVPPRESMEREVLLWLVGRLSAPEREQALETLAEPDRGRLAACLDALREDPGNAFGTFSPGSESKLGDPPYRLYPIIRRLCRLQGITVEFLAEEELHTTRESWYDWKGRWEKAERYRFEYLPHPRLKKRHLQIMALVFELDYLDTVGFLQIAGYRLGEDETDRRIARCLLDECDVGEDRKRTAEEIKRELQRM